MVEEIVTEVTVRNPRVSVQVRDFRVTSVHLSPESLEEAELEDYTDAVRQVLTQALTEHADEQMAQFRRENDPTEPNPDRDRALEFAYGKLEEAQRAGVTPMPSRQWFPDQADGRDATGLVHASVRGNEVVILEIPAQSYDDLRALEKSIREAVNLACDRQTTDVMKFAEKAAKGGEETFPDWSELVP